MDALADGIDINNFEAHWDKIEKEKKVDFIETSAILDPGLAILPVLKGLNSNHFSVRTQARKTLEIIQARIHSHIQNPSDHHQHLAGMKASAQVCAQLFSRLIYGISFDEQRYYFNILLKFEGNGPHFAFKAMYMNRINIATAEKIILALPELNRLGLIGEYLKSSPGIRLKYGTLFKRMIKSIKKSDTVIKFYAGLFDTQQDADPFLFNLDPDLRLPDQIIATHIKSTSPGLRTRGLKALAMIVSRLPSDLLLTILETETDLSVRKTLYKIIENSSLGTYPELFHPLLKLMETNKMPEALHAFKALIVSGRLPLSDVLDLVKKKQPHLMGHIYNEISTLSKISFFFIQDIALNKKKYFESHIEINFAAAFGMIKKRPERVVKILNHSIGNMDETKRQEVDKFVKKTNQLLARERLSIVKNFKSIVRLIKKQPEVPNGIFKSIFSSSTLKKNIAALKAGKINSPIDFNGQYIINEDLSSISCTGSAVYFSTSTIRNCDFSHAIFFNSYFKKCIFYNVDMKNTTCDSVCFTDAVFINVNAENAVFKNCSFQNIAVFNCNFNRAGLNSAFFIGATISKCSFDKTDLTGSTFAYSKISAVSFEHTNLEQADFTGVQARFCRFPTHARPAVSANDIDLNARQHQLKLTDMPKLDETMLSGINMLIFSEFIHYGEMKFTRQNKLSLLTAFDIFNTRQSDLFQMIPCLLHKNLNILGIKEKFHPKTPHGIFDYHPDQETIETVTRYCKGEVSSDVQPTASIAALYTIGSIGSIAQTSDSDIDYWVCIREDRFSNTDLLLLKKKLHIIEAYAWESFHIQVTFFLVDINKARQNDFGDSTIESSGSAQAILLKEEFYRTMIHVAGKLPLWAVLPTAISKTYYSRIFKLISSFPNLARYMDLGDIHTIHPGEFFGATIWQLFKSLKSPFKSVIKMALLEKYIHEDGQKPLLCNIVKDEWMNSGVTLKFTQNDAYYILLKNLLSYYDKSNDNNSATLLLTCFYLKLGISKTVDIQDTAFGIRNILLQHCMTTWNWSKDRLLKIGNYHTWPYHKIAGLSKILETFMLKKYKIVNNAFETSGHGDIQITPEDRTVLGRKVYSELSRRPGKIGKELLLSNDKMLFPGLHLKHMRSKDPAGAWELINKRTKNLDQADKLIRTESIEEIGAWMILNKMYNKTMVINLIPNPTQVTADSLRSLFNALYAYFSSAIKSPIGFDLLLKKETIARLFVSMNCYAPKHQEKITDYTAIYLNTWGEMFLKSFHSNPKPLMLREVIRQIKQQLGMTTLPDDSVYYLRGKTRKFV